MQNKRFQFFWIVAIISGCNKEKFFKGPNFFQDSFETYVTLSELLKSESHLWSLTQLTKDKNNIVIDSNQAYSGRKSIRFFAESSDQDGASKASIVKQHMAFWEGDTVRMSANYYIDGNSKLDWLFLMDLEEQTAIGAGPGMRLAMVDNELRIEYKFDEKDITQHKGTEVKFPRNQWVSLVWEVTLSQKNLGSVRLWQDGQIIIQCENKRTLPKDVLYFQQGTKGMYSSCEIGITANSKDNPLILWVDDVRFEKVNP